MVIKMSYSGCGTFRVRQKVGRKWPLHTHMYRSDNPMHAKPNCTSYPHCAVQLGDFQVNKFRSKACRMSVSTLMFLCFPGVALVWLFVNGCR